MMKIERLDRQVIQCDRFRFCSEYQDVAMRGSAQRKNPSQRRIASFGPDLSTSVERFMWTSVYNLKNNHLHHFSVDKLCINTPTYTQVIHSSANALSHCNSLIPKKKLDRLSTYPQSLLHLLHYKISLNRIRLI